MTHEPEKEKKCNEVISPPPFFHFGRITWGSNMHHVERRRKRDAANNLPTLKPRWITAFWAHTLKVPGHQSLIISCNLSYFPHFQILLRLDLQKTVHLALCLQPPVSILLTLRWCIIGNISVEPKQGNHENCRNPACRSFLTYQKPQLPSICDITKGCLLDCTLYDLTKQLRVDFSLL